jgi:hypothetical protein
MGKDHPSFVRWDYHRFHFVAHGPRLCSSFINHVTYAVLVDILEYKVSRVGEVVASPGPPLLDPTESQAPLVSSRGTLVAPHEAYVQIPSW